MSRSLLLVPILIFIFACGGGGSSSSSAGSAGSAGSSGSGGAAQGYQVQEKIQAVD